MEMLPKETRNVLGKANKRFKKSLTKGKPEVKGKHVFLGVMKGIKKEIKKRR